MSSASPRAWRARAGLGAVLVAGALTLSACGGSTVTSDELSETAAPAEDTATADDSESTATEESDQSETSSRDSSATESSEESASESSSQESTAEDQAAREISEIPPAEPEASSDDEQFLETVGMRGVDVAGVENQLIGTASTVCAGDGASAATAGAVAGQLIEQGRTDLAHEEVTQLIETSAREVYCP